MIKWYDEITLVPTKSFFITYIIIYILVYIIGELIIINIHRKKKKRIFEEFFNHNIGWLFWNFPLSLLIVFLLQPIINYFYYLCLIVLGVLGLISILALLMYLVYLGKKKIFEVFVK